MLRIRRIHVHADHGLFCHVPTEGEPQHFPEGSFYGNAHPISYSEGFSIVALTVKLRERRLISALFLLGSLLAWNGCSQEVKFKQYPVFYDLVENFPQGEVREEVTRIDLASPSARWHVNDGWSTPEGSGRDIPFVWSLGKKSALRFFLSEARDIKMAFVCAPLRFPGSPTQHVMVAVNGQQIQPVRLDPGFQEYEVILPHRAVVPGENLLEFRYSYARAPREVTKSTDTRRLAVRWNHIRFVKVGNPDQELRAQTESGRLFIPSGSQVDYYLKLPAQSVVTLEGLTTTGELAGSVHLALQREGEEEQILQNLQESSQFQIVSLPGDSPHLVRLSFRVAPQLSGSGGVTLVQPRIRTPRPLERAVADAPYRPPTSANGPKRPNIIIYLVDALRADHLGCYGYQKPVSPHIDAFAQDATLFENAIAQSSWTKASVASLFTGLTPTVHGVHGTEDRLSDKAVTLAETLRAEGYRTAAYMTNSTIREAFGFGQGFDEITHLPKSTSEEINQRIFPWLQKRREDERPFFLYVHTMDPHGPYSPPQDFRERFAGGVKRTGVKQPEVGTTPWLKALRTKKIPVNEDMIEDVISLYDGEIASNDHHFGLFINDLRRRRLYEEAFILFVSDHGEEFGERGTWIHGQTLYKEVLHIPLIVKFPSGSRTDQKRVTELAQHIDIFPTILDLLDLEIPDRMEGRTLLVPFSVRDPKAPPLRAFSHIKLYSRLATASVIEGPWKLIRRGMLHRSYALQLYHQEQDPGERKNLIEKYPVRAGYLLNVIKNHELNRGRASKSTKIVIDEDLRRQLKALGYIK